MIKEAKVSHDLLVIAIESIGWNYSKYHRFWVVSDQSAMTQSFPYNHLGLANRRTQTQYIIRIFKHFYTRFY